VGMAAAIDIADILHIVVEAVESLDEMYDSTGLEERTRHLL
jgi:hypothetical protein